MSKQWVHLSDPELESLCLRTTAENLQWILESCKIEQDRLMISGWAISLAGPPEASQFLINGNPFETVCYPLPSPDIASVFWNIAAAQNARFRCETTIDAQTYENGFACLEFLDGSERDKIRQRAWFLPDPKDDLPVPSDMQIRRVIGNSDRTNFLIGGASIYKRLQHYLEGRFSKTFRDFGNVLDFGCGCGRVARHFRWAEETQLWGVDVDGDNIAWCREHLRDGQFLTISALPPLPFPDESFDLVIATTVLSQMTEKYQAIW